MYNAWLKSGIGENWIVYFFFHKLAKIFHHLPPMRDEWAADLVCLCFYHSFLQAKRTRADSAQQHCIAKLFLLPIIHYFLRRAGYILQRMSHDSWPKCLELTLCWVCRSSRGFSLFSQLWFSSPRSLSPFQSLEVLPSRRPLYLIGASEIRQCVNSKFFEGRLPPQCTCSVLFNLCVYRGTSTLHQNVSILPVQG